MTKSTTVYLGDPYQTFLSLPAAIAATTLTVDDVSEFLAAGSASVGTQTVTYTSIVGNQLSGVTGLAAAATPSPVMDVKMGCASGDSTPRSTNVAPSSLTPPTSGRTRAPM